MNTDTAKQRLAEISLALILLVGAFFVFSVVFGFGSNPFSKKQKVVDSAQIEQNSLRSGILSEQGEIIEEFVPDPEPVPENEREYPAQRIFNLKNLRPITLQEAQEDLLAARELRRQQEALLAALDIENNEPDGQYVLQFLEELGAVNARSFLVGDLDTGEVIFERKAHDKYPIASISKYFTAFTAVKTLESNEVATLDASELQVEGSRAGFSEGDTFTIRELLYPLLLVSSNDAGEAIAQQRNKDIFISNMNMIASDNNLLDTTFEDPTGLSKDNISTARDLFSFMRLTLDEFPQIVGISQLSKKTINGLSWTNINKAINFSEFRGGKTGFTNAAQQTSIGYYEIRLSNKETKNIAVVILQSNTRQQDTRNILDYLKEHVAYRLKEEV